MLSSEVPLHPQSPVTSNLLTGLKIALCRCCTTASPDSGVQHPANSLSYFISSVIFICSANTTRDSIFTSSHCRSLHFPPLPRCQRYARALYPALLSFVWLPFNPPTRFNRPLRMRSTRRKEPWCERRQSNLPFASSKAAWKQPESSLKAARKQPSRERLPVNVFTTLWLTGCTRGFSK